MSEPRKLDAEELLAHAGWVRALAARLARDHDEADDVAQDALASAIASPPRAAGSVRSWLGRVVGNALRSRRRAERRRSDHEALASEWARPRHGRDPDLLAQLEEQQRLARLVRELPEPYRSVVLARYYRGESAARIARRTGVPAGTVRSQLARGLALLRRRFVEARGGDANAALALAAAARGPDGLALSTTMLSIAQGTLAVKTSTKLIAGGVAAAALLGWFYRLDGPGDRPDEPHGNARAGGPADLVAPSPPEEAVPAEPEASEAAPGRARAVLEAEADEAAGSRGAIGRTAVLTARVVGPSGDPLAGAVLRYLDERRPDHHAASPPAAADGAVELSLPEEALVFWMGGGVAHSTFSVEARDHGLHFLLATPALDERTDLGEIALVPGGRISGTVVDEHGAPRAGARVYFAGVQLGADPASARLAGPPRDDLSPGAPRLPGATTDADGRFTVPFAAAGPGRLWARGPEGPWAYGEPTEVAPGRERSGLRLELATPGDEHFITGRVLDPAGAPAAGVDVYHTPLDAFGYDTKTETDGGGDFRFTVESSSPYVLAVRDGERRWRVAVIQGVLAGQHVEIQLEEARWIEVTVVDGDGQPVEEPYVAARTTGLGDVWSHGPEQAGPGVVRVCVPEQPFHLDVYATGFRDAELGPFDPDTVPLEHGVRLEREPSFSGRVLAGGEPVAGATVNVCRLHEHRRVRTEGFQMRYDVGFTSRGVETDAGGRFEAPAGAARGTFLLAARAEGWALAEWGPFELDGEGLRGVELVLTPGGSIAGTLRMPAGRDPGGQLIVTSRGDGLVHRVRTGADGSYRFDGLTPGPWRVEHRRREQEQVWTIVQKDEIVPVEWNCQVFEGSTTRHDIDLTADALAVFTGRLTVEGAPAAGWTATLQRRGDHERRDERGTVLDADGRFELRDEPGDYRLVLEAPPVPGAPALELQAAVTLALPTGEEHPPWERHLRLGTLFGTAVAATTLRFRVGDDGASVTGVFEAPAGPFEVRVPSGEGVLERREPAPVRHVPWTELGRLELLPGRAVEADVE